MPAVKADQSAERRMQFLPRSASYSSLPRLDSVPSDSQLRKTASEVDLPRSPSSSSFNPDPADFVTEKEILRRTADSLAAPDGSRRIFHLPDDDASSIFSEPVSETIPPSGRASRASERSQSKSTVSGMISSLRKPWKSSPSTRPSTNMGMEVPAVPAGRARSNTNFSVDSQQSTFTTLTRTGTRRNSFSSKAPSITSTRRPSMRRLRSKVSLERITASLGASSDVPPLPHTPPQFLGNKPESSRKRDELWTAFRSIDADLPKFRSKSTSLKANILRSSFLPFLERYAIHPSNRALRPEDLDRRIHILNKWWTSLLETLNTQQSAISASDRPTYFDSIVGIMARPEWRLPSPSDTLKSTHGPTRFGTDPSLSTPSTSSVDSGGSDFLLESIHHNIRNMFTQNLMAQISFCIDKLSTRHTPVSLVSFSAKTCAYSFFHSPDIADMLVRLWHPTPDGIRKVVGAFGIEANPKVRFRVSAEVASYFPVASRRLAFSSNVVLMRHLRRATKPPLGTLHVNWVGPWVSRWTGRDSDMFFLFVKHYHILMSEFLPHDTPKSNLLYVPGLVPVYAQLSRMFENTLRAATLAPENSLTSASPTFDDLIDSTDVSVAPLGAANSLRVPSENRLLLLLKDVIVDPKLNSYTRFTIVESFCTLLKVVTRSTSLFDHHACFILLEFVEEFIAIITPYSTQTSRPDLLDWDFWLDVCLQMMESNNSLTELRAFTFIYSVWDRVTSDSERKQRLCLRILLHDTVFYKYFNHWSAMVRSYFHRLLCWRLARCEDTSQGSELDEKIYSVLQEKLNNVWEYFLHAQSKAERGLCPYLSTSPSNPAPGRRLLIFRSDSNPQPSMFVCLDNVIPSGSFADNTAVGPSPSKKKWKGLKSLFGGQPASKSSQSSEESERPRSSTPLPGSGPSRPTESSSMNATGTGSRYVFRFSLEWVDQRNTWANKNIRLFPPTLPIPAKIFLQSKARDRSQQNRNFRLEKTEQPNSTESSDQTPLTDGSGSESNITPKNSDTESDDSAHERSDREMFDQTPRQSPPPLKLRIPESVPAGRSSYVSTKTPRVLRPPRFVPPSCDLVASKYAGRSLAEWAMVVMECDNFAERRKNEGVLGDRFVEIPILGVDGFRSK